MSALTVNGDGTHDATRAALDAMRDELRLLRKAIRQLQTARPVQIVFGSAPQQTAAVLGEPAPGEKGQVISPIALDILKVIEESPVPLTGTRLLEAMARRGMEWSRTSVENHLASMIRDGTLENPGTAKPRGYRIPATPSGIAQNDAEAAVETTPRDGRERA